MVIVQIARYHETSHLGISQKESLDEKQKQTSTGQSFHHIICNHVLLKCQRRLLVSDMAFKAVPTSLPQKKTLLEAHVEQAICFIQDEALYVNKLSCQAVAL